MKELTVELADSDGNPIYALIEYNPQYKDDYSVLSASVCVNHSWLEITNLELIRAQYSGQIINKIHEDWLCA